MKLDLPKAWYEQKAKDEEGHDVSAGASPTVQEDRIALAREFMNARGIRSGINIEPKDVADYADHRTTELTERVKELEAALKAPCSNCEFEPYDLTIFDECGGLRVDWLKPEGEQK